EAPDDDVYSLSGGLRRSARHRTPAEFRMPESAYLLDHYRRVRAAMDAACQPLSAEDMQVQSMPDASPAKWHLAHTSWFFEYFVLAHPVFGKYDPFDPNFNYLFNSYYESVGVRHPRPKRGLLTRPTVERVCQYRKYVDDVL